MGLARYLSKLAALVGSDGKVPAAGLASGEDFTFNGVKVGKGAGSVATNTAVGASALAANTTGTSNTSFGSGSLQVNTSGNYNTAAGVNSLTSNSTGNSNSAFGIAALNGNTTGSSNTSVGFGSLQSNTTASNNTAVGYQAGYSNQTGSANTFIGYQAGYTTTGGPNGRNVFVGEAAGYSNTTGRWNTYIGHYAGQAMTTGASNTIIGRFDGNLGGLDIRTASNYIVLSDGDGNPRGWWDNSGVFYASPTRIRIISNAIADQSGSGNNTGIVFSAGVFPANGSGDAVDNSKPLGSGSFRWSVVYAATGTINTSDVNAKQDIAVLDDAEKRVAVAIKSLIKKYRFKDAVAEKGDAARIHVGAVAQEVATAFVSEGLDPARYALFCSDTWYEVNGAASSDKPYTAETEGAVEVTRLGLRYEELLAFVIAAM